jgi:AraC-like DNA-binding protein
MLASGGAGGLERLCGRRGSARAGDRVRLGRPAEGIERLEAHFHGQPFAPHRHDTYAIGISLAGVLSFRFRAERWHCLPGQCHILHPDEPHDGGAGTDAGFAYRIVYIDPALVQQALHGSPLPFVASPVVEAARLPGACAAAICDIDVAMDELAQSEFVTALADLLADAASVRRRQPRTLALAGLARVREAIAARPAERPSVTALERLSGLDRFTLARQFRAAYGTTATRFCTMRQLDHVRRLLIRGTPLAEAALAAGFADQSHMTRRFRQAYGLPPGAWIAACRAAQGGP